MTTPSWNTTPTTESTGDLFGDNTSTVDYDEPTVDAVDEEEETEVAVEEKPKRASKPRATKPRAASKPRAAAKGGLTRATASRAVTKTIEVSNLDDADRALLASVLGTEDDVEEIAITILLGGAKTEGIAEAIALSEIVDDADRAIEAALLGASTKAVWAVFNALELVGAEAPESTSKTARALSDAARELADDSDIRDRLDNVVEITK